MKKIGNFSLLLLISMSSLSFSMKRPKNDVSLEAYVDESLPHHCKLCNKIANSASNGAKWTQKLEENYVSMLKFCIDELRNVQSPLSAAAKNSDHLFLFACHGFISDKRKLRETIEAISKNEAKFCTEQKYCQMF